MARTTEKTEPTLSPAELAIRLKVSPGTLSNWRYQGVGPKFTRNGRGRKSPVRYKVRDVEAWEAAERRAGRMP